MNKRRLNVLAKFLATKVPRHRFNYRAWVGHSWAGQPDLSCGAPACALGWATTIPAFRKLGLRLVRTNQGEEVESDRSWRSGGYVTDGKRVLASAECNRSLSAAMRLFDLDLGEAGYLFTPDESGLPEGATPKQVARHIRAFVARGGMPS